MRRAAIVLVLAASCGGARPPDFTILTFNVLCSFCDTANYDPWEARLEAFRDILKRHDPDIFGLQELFTAEEVRQIGQRAPGYGAVYFSDPERRLLVDYPDAALYYRESLFELRESGVYWLSETPDVPWSGGWANAQIWRLVAWARLRYRPDGRELYAATVHVDNNHPNQEKSAPLMLGRTAAFAATIPAILVGDFNSKPGSTAYAALAAGLTDAYEAAEKRDVLHDEAQAPAYDAAQRIDHIFLSGPRPIRVTRWSVDLFRYGAQRRYPSDHFAISARISL